MNHAALKLIIYVCLIQFLAVLVYTQLLCSPKTKLHVAMVGISAVLGLLVSGAAYNAYYSLKAEEERKQKYTQLDETLQKLKDEEKS